VHFVANVKRYEQSSDLLDDAGVLELSAIDGAHARDLCGQFRGGFAGIVVISAD
jgi:hypothetical protein